MIYIDSYSSGWKLSQMWEKYRTKKIDPSTTMMFQMLINLLYGIWLFYSLTWLSAGLTSLFFKLTIIWSHLHQRCTEIVNEILIREILSNHDFKQSDIRWRYWYLFKTNPKTSKHTWLLSLKKKSKCKSYFKNYWRRFPI